MTTQPMNQYLTPARLTDLAQFAVPDGHDLWPEIERAARRSKAAISTTSSPGMLSLGIIGAWTAVGILLIAATFAILGFALAVLVLSSGEKISSRIPTGGPRHASGFYSRYFGNRGSDRERDSARAIATWSERC